MDMAFISWLFAVSAAASALGGMLGMASGIFIVPILTTFGHIEIHTAIGASIVSVIACSCGIHRQGQEDGNEHVPGAHGWGFPLPSMMKCIPGDAWLQ